MQRKALVWIIVILLFFAGVSHAGKHQRYVVREGDTLWTISQRFYGSPLYWYFVWESNKDKVKNPHWIYPGEVLLIPPREEVLGKPVVKMKKPERPLFTWQMQVFVPYITRHLPKEYGYVSKEAFDPEKTLYSKWDYFNVRLVDGAVNVDDTLLVYRVLDRDFRHPLTDRWQGYLVKNLAVAKVVKVKGGMALAQVLVNSESVMEGDVVTVFRMPEPIYKLNYDVGSVQAKVITFEEGKTQPLLGDIALVDAGGLQPGDVLFVYQRPWNKVIAELVVLKSTDIASTCYINKLNRGFEIGADVASKALLEMR